MNGTDITHPPSALLTDFVAGQLDLSMRVLIETHLEFCTQCSRTVGELTRAGSLWLAATPAASPPADVWAQLSARVDSPDETEELPLPSAARAELAMPRGRVRSPGARPSALKTLRWLHLPFSDGEVAVLDHHDDVVLLLGRAGAGQRFPNHRHLGGENVVVIEGGYQDDRGHWLAGTWAQYPAGSEHAPLADTDGPCVVLARLAGGVQFTGPCGWAITLQRLFAPLRRKRA
jgi:putative transcriptional regulator